MERIELEVDAETLERARRVAASRHCTIEQLLRDLITELGPAKDTADAFLGMLADEPELMDQVVESAMRAREAHPLRRAGG